MQNMKSKKCNKCGESKLISEFRIRPKMRLGLANLCKHCEVIATTMRSRTKEGLVCKIYCQQVSSSKERGDKEPEFSKSELMQWMFSQDLFHVLFDKWVDSGYKKELIPSCDRTDDYKEYSLNRLKIMTWGDNFNKGHYDRKHGINNKMNKAVVGINIDNGKVFHFHSIMEATRNTKARQSCISLCCNGKQKKAGGYFWKYKIN